MNKILFLLLLIPCFVFGQTTDATLTTQAQQIKNETTAGANTANRVGTHLQNLVYSKKSFFTDGTASGTNTYSVTLNNGAVTALSSQWFVVKFTNANSGASTLNINAIGAKSLVKTDGTALSSGDIDAGSVHLLSYDGTNLQVLSLGGGGGSNFWRTDANTTVTEDIVIDGSAAGKDIEMYFDSFVMSTATSGFGFDAAGADFTGDTGYTRLRSENGADDVLIETTPTNLTLDTDQDMTWRVIDDLIINGSSGTTGQVITNTNGTPAWGAAGSTVTPAALTKTDDTNVTLTLGGTPSTALLQATSLTLGWTGTLSATRGGTGLSSLGTGVATWLGTPSSANLASAVTGETGTGALVFDTSPTLTTPNLGTPSAATLTNATGYPVQTESLDGTAQAATLAEVTTGTLHEGFTVSPSTLNSWAKYKMVVLGSDDTNNNGSANTLEDVGGLSFAVVTGGVYYFRFVIDYTSAATTTGCRWTVNGPAATRLNYDVRFPTTATAESIQFGLTALDGGTVSGQTVTSGKATVEGFYTAAGDGTFVLRFSSEVSASAVVAKAGSICLYARLN